MGEFFSFLGKNISNIFSLSVDDVIFLIVCFVILFFVFLFLFKSNAGIVPVTFIVYVFFIGILLFAVKEEGKSGKTDYVLHVVLAVMFLLILFGIDLKRFVWKTNIISKGDNNGGKGSVSQKSIDGIVKAVLNMSKANTGAIIILTYNRLPESIIESGTVINADISNQIIESIFFPNSPLHDGAMIIQGNNIMCAGCFLPLSQNVNLPKELGTRHRAGIGITETIDVITIIVSEESGVISIAKAGKIERYIDSKTLRKVLRDFYYIDLVRK